MKSPSQVEGPLGLRQLSSPRVKVDARSFLDPLGIGGAILNTERVEDFPGEGLTGVTRAMHMCRGNAPGGMWAATGGYEVISKEVFPRLSNLDRLLLEYDSDRAGGFAPLADVLPHQQVVLGLVTTKDGKLEEAEDIVSRVEEATRYVPLDRLAISPQCGFASGEIARTMTLAEQEAKLRLVGDIAQRVWR